MCSIETLNIDFKDIDECASNPCKNGGTCIENIGGYSCDCPDGYAGENCATGESFHLPSCSANVLFNVSHNTMLTSYHRTGIQVLDNIFIY